MFLKIDLVIQFSIGIYPTEVYVYKDICTSIFITLLFIPLKNWKKTKYLTTEDCVKSHVINEVDLCVHKWEKAIQDKNEKHSLNSFNINLERRKI